MNVKHYEEILEQFKEYHPYLANGIKDWRPKGDMGIRVETNDGKLYDFHSMSKTVRNVETRPMHHDDSFSEKEWREIFADRLAEYMNTKCITQQALAECTGLSKGAISNYLKGNTTPSGYALTKLSRAFDCTVMDLID